MTATDDLRLLLDERGVEHTDGYDLTEWLDEQGRTVVATDSVAKCRLNDRKMVVRRVMTPEQAITATLGRGTCHIVMTSPGWWECDECANSIDWDSCDPNDPPSCNFCPNCGREVIE